MRKITRALINRMTDGDKAHTALSRVLRRVPLKVWDALGHIAEEEE